MNTQQSQSEATKLDFPSNVDFTDDMDVSLNPDEYVDPAPPLPLLAGTYAVRITDSGLKRVRENGVPTDEIVLIKNEQGEPTFPVIEVKKITIADAGEGNENMVGRSAYPFQEFSTKPTTRRDFNRGGESFDFNHLSAIIRGHDATLGYKGLDEGLNLYKSLVSDGAKFFVRTDWVAEDRKWIREQVALIDQQEKAGELTAEAAKKARNEVRYKTGKQEGMTKFIVREGENVYLNPVWVGPSGDEIEARVQIVEFVSTANKRIKLGPRQVK